MERQEKKRDGKFWTIMLLISINLYLPYVLFSENMLLWIALLFSAIILSTFLIKDFKSKKELKYSTNAIHDVFLLMKKYASINRKYLLITSIGLILSISIFSSTVLVVNSYQEKYTNSVNMDNTPSISIKYEYVTDRDSHINIVDFSKNIIKTAIEESGYFIDNIGTQFELQMEAVPDTYNDTSQEYYQKYSDVDVQTLNYSNTVYETLVDNEFIGENFMYNSNEKILVIPTEYMYLVFSSNDTNYPYAIRIFTYETFNDTSNIHHYYYYQLNVSRIISVSSNKLHQYIYSKSGLYLTLGITLLQSAIETDQLYNYLFHNSSDQENTSLRIHTKSDIMTIVNYYIQDDFEFSYSYVIKMQKLVDDINRILYLDENQKFAYWFSWGYASSYRANQVENILENVLLLQFYGAISTIIISLVSLFLVYFAVSLTQNRKEKVMRIMRSRGTDILQLRSMLYWETFIISIFSSAIGMLLSLLWAKLALNTSGFLKFHPSDLYITIPVTWFFKIPLMAFILCFDISFSKINQLSRILVDDYDDERKKIPLWQKKQIDLIFTVICVLYWVVLHMVNFDPYSPEYAIFQGLIGFYVTIFFLIVAPLVFARLFTNIVNYIATIRWKKQGDLNSLTLKMMKKYRFGSSKLVSLIIISVLLSTIFIIIPTTIDSYNHDYGYYANGADMYIPNLNVSDPILQRLLNNDSIASYSEIYRLGIRENIPNTYYDKFYTILGVNTSSFVQTAYWEKSFGDLDKIINALNANSIVLDRNYVNINKLEFGKVNFHFENYTYNFNYNATFEGIPKLRVPYSEITNYWSSNIEQSAYILMNLTMAKEIGSLYFKDYQIYKENGLYIKLVEGIDANSYRNYLNGQIEGYDVLLASDYYPFSYDDPVFNAVIFSSIHALLLFTILATFISFAIYIYISIRDRKIELGMYRTMGITSKQIFKMFIVENLVILFYGIISAIITSTMIFLQLSFVFKGFYTGESEVFAIELQVPWVLLSVFLALLISLNFVIAILPPYRLTKQKVANILRLG